MSLFGDYTDGVPVKISEKYKPPPRIELGRGAAECEARATRALDTAHYGFAFDSRVLGKLAELRAAKETLRSERRHRLRLLDEAEQRRLDDLAAAAEAEERLKQLSVSAVSYPSAEDFGEARGARPPEPLLQPTQLRHSPARDLLAEPDPLRALRSPHPPPRPLRTLTFSDFEHDTSSPFDALELESINELEQLAQVLQPPPLPLPHYINNEANCDNTGPPYNEAPGYAYYNYTPARAGSTPPPPVKSRSRSVLDILRELSEEVASQRARRSHAGSPAASPAPVAPPAPPPPPPPPDPYEELSPRLQEMCRSIESMGFPRERVARVCSLLGDSDKKVIEGLLLVGQLLDLGFPESRVAAALAKHHFNRDKALDELIA